MIACSLALVLLMDVSGSVSADRYALQHAGVAHALTEPQVERALLSQEGGMAITVIEWSDRRQVVVPWHMVRDHSDVGAVAEILAGAQRTMTGSTAMGDAMRDALNTLNRAPCEPSRKVIDISGDGRNNDGSVSPDDMRLIARASNVVVNGLPIRGDEPDVGDYYRAHVVTEDGFVVEAKSFDDFAAAIRTKLLTEISELSYTVN